MFLTALFSSTASPVATAVVAGWQCVKEALLWVQLVPAACASRLLCSSPQQTYACTLRLPCRLFERDGVRVVCDDISLEFLRGSTGAHCCGRMAGAHVLWLSGRVAGFVNDTAVCLAGTAAV